MDVCKSFFQYKVYTLCGFPEITLKGTHDDWKLVRAKAEKILNQRCEPTFAKQWSAALLPVLDRCGFFLRKIEILQLLCL